MTSRRSMLQGMAALWLAGWRGLGGSAVAVAAPAEHAKSSPPPELAQPKRCERSQSGAIITYTYYDAQGQVVMTCDECPDLRPNVIEYEYV